MEYIGLGRIVRFTSFLVALVLGFSRSATPVPISYFAPTNQTATADFNFLSGTSLQIVLTETTPMSAFLQSGATAILTSIGFLLPDSAVIVLPGTVTINVGSMSVDFSGGAFGAGDDVSAEWGATIGGQAPIGNGNSYDFVSTNAAQVTQFAGTNRDGPTALDGPQGGLLDDSAARGGTGVIDRSVVIVLSLDADPLLSGNQALSMDQQTAFLESLPSSSVSEWGSDFSFGHPVIPEPATLVLLGVGLLGLGARGQLNRRARPRSS